MSWVTLIFVASFIALVLLVWSHRDVVGYQDEEGFHFGTAPDDSLDDLEWPEKRRAGRK